MQDSHWAAAQQSLIRSDPKSCPDRPGSATLTGGRCPRIPTVSISLGLGTGRSHTFGRTFGSSDTKFLESRNHARHQDKPRKRDHR